MWKKFEHWFGELSRLGKVIFVTLALFSIGTAGNAVDNPQPSSNQKITLTTQSAKSSDVVTQKKLATTEAIPYQTETIKDSSLAQDTTKVQTEGVNGVRTQTFNVTYKDGKEVSRSETSNEITTPPVSEIVRQGTYVAPAKPSCPNGTYINSSDSEVCRPYQTNTAPEGATAHCRDGSYSFSQHHSGTCSGHGGVATWL